MGHGGQGQSTDVQIEKLCSIVAKKTEEGLLAASKANEEPAPEFVCAARKMTVLRSGSPVYVRRYGFMVFVYCAVATAMIAQGVAHTSVGMALLCAAMMFFMYDIYSGVLHVVLDCQDNLNLPLIGQACLEFQWHHHISGEPLLCCP